MGNIGPDVSGFQAPRVLASGDWLFAFVKLSEGTGASNRNFTQQWSDALRFFKRGVYHYARPHSSDGVHQANTFCDLALAAGFKPGVDMWALDAEGLGNDVRALGNEQVTGPEWAAFIRAFMTQAQTRLGPIGFLYVGQYFFPADIGPLTQLYPWWDPNYGANDGQIHALSVNPVLHQFTSAGGLDKSVVHDLARWNALTGATHTVPSPAPQRKVQRVLSVTGLGITPIDANHNPYIDIVDGGKAIACFFAEPFLDGPQVKTAFGLQVFTLAAGETAIDLAALPNGNVLVRLANNEAHIAPVRPGVVTR